MAPNLSKTPPPEQGEEVWPSNWHKGYVRRLPRSVAGRGEWTRWFNLHSHRHMTTAYPSGYDWYKSHDGTRPIVLQRPEDSKHPENAAKALKEIPGAVGFPKKEIIEFFGHAYFTCSVCWFIALAIMEGFERIELWGFEVRATKPKYAFERPCIAFWIQEAERRGIEVWTPPEMARPLASEAGDPSTYDGPVYGYETT